MPDDPSSPPSAAPAPAPAVERPRFSPHWTALSACLLLAVLARLTYLHLTIPAVELLPAPEQALALTVNRTLELEAGLADAAPWERLVYGVTMQTGLEVLDETIGWYRELDAHSSDPAVALHLAILEGEAGHLARVRELVGRWKEDGGEPFDTFAALVEAAYLVPAVPAAREERLQAELAEILPAGWFYDTLAIRLAERAGHRAFAESVRGELHERGRLLLERLRGFLAFDLVMIVGAGIALAGFLRRGCGSWTVGGAAVPPPWSGSRGATVLIRGAALGALVLVALLFLDLGDSPLRALAVPLINLPLLVLAYRHLLVPHDLSPAQGLGLAVAPAAGRRALALVVLLVGAGLLGEGLLALLAERAGWSSHWSEWFDPELVWGGPQAVALALLEYVVLAPLFEEVVFRGLLFPTVRRRLGLVSSALLSATIFGLAHGYGPVGLISVIWSGVLWSWAYERSGSLLPGILAHAANNLVVCLTVMAMLR